MTTALDGRQTGTGRPNSVRNYFSCLDFNSIFEYYLTFDGSESRLATSNDYEGCGRGLAVADAMGG